MTTDERRRIETLRDSWREFARGHRKAVPVIDTDGRLVLHVMANVYDGCADALDSIVLGNALRGDREAEALDAGSVQSE